jgi:hypothetical protein
MTGSQNFLLDTLKRESENPEANIIEINPITVREAQSSAWTSISASTRRCIDPYKRKALFELNTRVEFISFGVAFTVLGRL